MTFQISIAESILTRNLLAGVGNLPGAELGTGSDGFVVVETAHLASLPNHRIHPDVGICLRDRGVVVLQSAVRPDELQKPLVWIRTSGPTAELLARASIGQYFGFQPRGWVDSADANAEAVVCDEAAALVPLESGFREDLTRAWFVLTGFRFVSHLLAVPQDAEPGDVKTVAAWFGTAGALGEEERRAVGEAVAADTGAPLEEIIELLSSIRWTLESNDRRSVAEFFARSGVARQVGPIRWWRNENEPKE